jgi:fructan beta-fructosidase
MKKWLCIVMLLVGSLAHAQQQVHLKLTRHYLNIPIGRQARMKLLELKSGDKILREIPVQLAEDSIDYWIFVDVSDLKGRQVTLEGPSTAKALQRIYEADTIAGADNLYHERDRPQYHFTVKRGWSNDINGPIWYNGEYHLFWQSFPYGLIWNTGFMNWGHAVSKDLLHWQELDPALWPDSLGSPWSGTAVVDKNNDGGWGKNALVLYYACFDRISEQEVQCIAYSTDGARTFQHYSGNPVLNTDWEVGSTNTRDPKVFWYAPAKTWVMVLFEKDGMSFFNATDMRHWTRESHFPGLWECPDFFELPVDGDNNNKKWVLHGGSSEYFIGSFDGKTFIPETPRLSYAEGRSDRRGELLYATQSFENMPDDRRVQIAWGRIDHPGMPFTQMMLFPTEFRLKTTTQGIRLQARPIGEIAALHGTTRHVDATALTQANRGLATIPPGPLHIKMTFTLPHGNTLRLRYQGNTLFELSSHDLAALASSANTPKATSENTASLRTAAAGPQTAVPGSQIGSLEILIDKTVAEIFLNDGERYIVKQLDSATNSKGLEFDGTDYGPSILSLDVYEMQSVWK